MKAVNRRLLACFHGARPYNRAADAMNYAELVAYLDRSWTKGPEVGTVDQFPFDELRALLARRGDPQAGLRVAHVTGSKGKGSVATLIAAILRAHGLATGTFTGPHLVDVEERIGTGAGIPIDREELALRLSELIESEADSAAPSPSIWRLLLVVALEHFRDTGVHVAAVEVGRGGRFDATNILDGAVACITPIGLEHVPRLGRTTAEIAAQKVAIVKSNAICVSAPQHPEVDAVIEAGVALAGARWISLGRDAHFNVHAMDRAGVVADLQTPHRKIPRVRLSLLGRHQAENAAVALCAAEQLLAACGRQLDEASVRSGLANVHWPARLEVLRADPLRVYDGAHTAESAAVLAEALRDHFPGVRWTFIVGLLTRRDAGGILSALARVGERVICVPVSGFESVEPEALAARARVAGLIASTAESVSEALAEAGDAPTCVTGSLYLYQHAIRQ